MLDLSPEKIFVLGLFALVVLGPNRLPGAARSLGRIIGQLRSMSSSFQSEVRDALHDPQDALNSAVAEFRPADIRRSVRSAVTGLVDPQPSARRPVADRESPPAPTVNPDDPSLN